jgi:DNA-binding MarR family transcriptional regulator
VTESPDLDVGLLYRLVRKIAEFRAVPLAVTLAAIGSAQLEAVLDEYWSTKSFGERRRHLNRHLDFLELAGFISIKARLDDRERAGIALTLAGHKFVQPELAEFGQAPLLPEVVKSIEQELQALTRPIEEKETLLFKLHEAVSKHAPDLVVKFLVELSAKLMKLDA